MKRSDKVDTELLRHFHGQGYGLRDSAERMGATLARVVDLAKREGLVFPDHAEVIAGVVDKGRRSRS